jgi:hypothetical protein
MKLIQRLIYKIPKYIDDVWYNQSAYMSDRFYPIIRDSNDKYIECKLGLKVIMDKLPSGKLVYYKVIKIRNTRGSDYLCSSDSINCKLKFSHLG